MQGSRVATLVRTARDRAGLTNADIAAQIVGMRQGASFDGADLGRELTRDLDTDRAERLIRATIDALLDAFSHGKEDDFQAALERRNGLQVAGWLVQEANNLGLLCEDDVFNVLAGRALGVAPTSRRAKTAARAMRQLVAQDPDLFTDAIRQTFPTDIKDAS